MPRPSFVRSRRRCATVAACLLTAAVASAQKPPLQRLADLAGEWTVIDDRGESTDLVATYRVVAGGAAVSETLFVGHAEETTTIYHVERSRVTATQLSGRGVPARFGPKPSNDVEQLTFERSDGGDGRIEHVAAIDLTFTDESHVRIEWTIVNRADEPVTRRIELERRASLEDLAARVQRMQVSLDTLQQELDGRLKRVVERRQGKRKTKLLETRTQPPGPGWTVFGVPFRATMFKQWLPFSTTFAAQGDKGMTVGHYGFRAGKNGRVRFSVFGGHAYVALIEERKAPPRRIDDIPKFSEELLAGKYGPVVERISGGRQSEHARAAEWTIERLAGKPMRLYVVDAVASHYGQIAISEVSILEESK